MTDIISPDDLQTLRLGRGYYYDLYLKLFDHYSYDENIAIFIKTC